MPEDNQRIIPLSDVNVEYKIRRHSDKIYKEMEEETAMRKFNAMLNKLLITDHELSRGIDLSKKQIIGRT